MTRTLCLQTKAGAEGAGWFAQELAQAIANTGFRVIFVAPPAVPASREPTGRNLTRFVVPANVNHGLMVRRVGSSMRRVWGGWWGCLRARAETRDYLFSVPDPLVFFLPLQLLLVCIGARVHLVVHDAVPHAWKLPRLIQAPALTASYKLCARLITTTADNAEDLVRHFGVRRDRVIVVPHGAYVVKAATKPPDTHSFLLFGTLRRNKGVLEAIEAIQLCRKSGLDVHLKIAGAPDKVDLDYWRDCEAAIATAPEGIETAIGFVPDDEVEALVARADAVLLPYRDFSSQSGVAVLMVSAARPVIAASVGGIAELFDYGMAGIRLSNRPTSNEVADAIRAFNCVGSEEWYRRALRARDDVNAKIGWPSIAQQQLRAIFGDVVVSGTLGR